MSTTKEQFHDLLTVPPQRLDGFPMMGHPEVPDECRSHSKRIPVDTPLGTICLPELDVQRVIEDLLTWGTLECIETGEDAARLVKRYAYHIVEKAFSNWPAEFGHDKASLFAAERDVCRAKRGEA